MDKLNRITGRLYYDFNCTWPTIKEVGHDRSTINPCLQLSATLSIIVSSFSFTPTQKALALVTIDSPVVLPTDGLAATKRKALRVRLLEQLATTSSKVCGSLCQNHCRHKKYFDRNTRTMPNFSIG